MADLATLQTWLTEAEQARHDCALGNRVDLAMRGGRQMRFGKADLPQLDAYIQTLKNEIAGATADASGCPRRRAIGVVW